MIFFLKLNGLFVCIMFREESVVEGMLTKG